MSEILEKFKIIKKKTFEIFDKDCYKEVSAKDYAVEKHDKIVNILKICIVEGKPEVKE